jgi:hypothetical protein
MRSCLIQLLIAVAVVFALLWFGLPFGASWLATNALNTVGFTGTNTKVDISATLPPRILMGHADKIRLTSTQVSVGDLHAATIDVTMRDVELLNRTFGSVDGVMTGVRIPAPNGDAVSFDTVSVQGSSTAASATLTLSNSEAERVAEAQLKASTTLDTKIKFSAPDKAVITFNGQSKTGHLIIRDGSMVLVPDGTGLPTVTVLQAGNGNPFSLTSVNVGATSMMLTGTIDLQTLLGL